MARHRRRRRRYEPSRQGSLAGIARRGAALSGLTLVLVQMISVGSTLAIARLLSPAEVGLYAAGTVLSGFIIVFTEGGLRQALVQRQEDIEDAADTVFYTTAATGVLLSLLALATAPLVGLVFDNPDAAKIAAVTSGMFLLHALMNVPNGLMLREFAFKRRLIIDPTKAVVYGVVTIAFAALGYGVWALVIGNYASLAAWLIGSWILAKWRPGQGNPSVRLWREMSRFAYPLVGWSLSSLTRDAVQTALLGRGLGEAALGQYRYGRRLGDIPKQAVVQIGSFVIFPAFSRMAGEPERFRRGFFRALRWIWLGAVAMAGLLLALGQPAVLVLLGEQWRAAGVVLMAISGVGACVALQEVAGEAMKGAGRSQRLNYLSVLELVVGIGLLLALLPLGLLGVGLAVLGMELTIAVTAMALARSVVGFTGRELVRALLPALVAAAAAVAAIATLDRLVVRSGERGTMLGVLALLGLSVLYGLVYLLALRLLDRSVVKDLLSGVRRILTRRGAGATDAGGDEPEAGGATDAAPTPPTTPPPPGSVEATTPLAPAGAVEATTPLAPAPPGRRAEQDEAFTIPLGRPIRAAAPRSAAVPLQPRVPDGPPAPARGGGPR
ncbi:MAG TPA: oligosaccharide flippase family protein [Pseudonocardia sp.]|nr:oligosaccharide flippase family protein [Pseudonocardia sp.]